MKTIEEVRHELETRKDRSAWNKGVTVYALELLEELEENRNYTERTTGKPINKHLHPLEIENELLNGAPNWVEFSWGGCSLIYDSDIAERLCTPSELKKTRHGERRPNSREEWLDTQARALKQAYTRIYRIVKAGM